MKKKIYQVDAFTEEPFKGNPAGVMFCDTSVSGEWMQQMAMEMNLSETAFLIPGNKGFEIRYFTPVKEVPLCGHATLASAHMIYELGLVKPNEPCSLQAKGGNLTVNLNNGWITMNFPAYSFEKIPTPPGFKELIGFEPIEVYASLYDWVIALAAQETEIQEATPNFEQMGPNGLAHLMITAKSNRENTDFVVRCFAPVAGINEDPVTGSAHCALTPFWAEKLHKTEMNSLQLSKRTGKMQVKLLENNRVQIKGKAITIFEADLKI